jgi:hypothetical protein
VIDSGPAGTLTSMRGGRFLLSLGLLAASTAAGGCVTHTCTLDIRTSVSLSVVDAETGEDVDATVTFLLDGEGPHEPEEGWPGTYVLASETEGTFEVTIGAEGYETVMREYVVTGDECHVESQSDTIELVPVP